MDCFSSASGPKYKGYQCGTRWDLLLGYALGKFLCFYCQRPSSPILDDPTLLYCIQSMIFASLTTEGKKEKYKKILGLLE